jgi:hypothetical protein
MTINPGHIPVGTIYQQKVFAGGNEQDLEIECGPTGPGSTAPLLNTNSSPFTYNNNTQSAQFLYQCENCYAYQFSTTSCYAGPNNTGILVTLAYVSGSNTEIILTFQAGSNVAAGNWPIYCNSSAGILVPAGYVVVEAAPCQGASVSINDQGAPGQKFSFTQVPGTGVFANGVYTPNRFSSPVSATPSVAGGTYFWSVDNTAMVQFSSPSSGTGSTSTGPLTSILVTEQTDANVAGNPFGRTAVVTVTYTGPCGIQTASFKFVLTEDVTVIAYVDSAKTIADANDPNSPSYMNFAALNSEQAGIDLGVHLNNIIECGIDANAWAFSGSSGSNNITLPFGGLDPITDDIQRRYANYFFTAGTANTLPGGSNSPPSQIDTATLRANHQYYRIYNRFEAAYPVSSGPLVQPIQVLHGITDVGLTLEPCTGLQSLLPYPLGSPIGELYTFYDGTIGVSSNGTLIYQLNEGRVGAVGQAANAYLNKRPGFGTTLAPQYTSYTQTTAYVWSAIQFDKAGNLQPLVAGSDSNLPASTANNVSVYSTFVVYKDGQKASSVTLQGDVESFISLDFNYRYFKPQ